MTIVPLSEATAEETFGGKASSLARAMGAGLPVPPGYAISWERVAKIVNGDASVLLLESRVAVRSSAIGEDSADASFAGQHATILNVTSQDALADAVRTIHASSRAEGALEYRKRMGIDGEPRIAVVVQQMVDADVAGVMFTRDPVTGRNECVIEAAWGLGEGVVSGLVTPDRYRMTADGAIVERIAAKKEIAIRRAPEGGTMEVPLHGDEAERLTLTDTQLAALHELAKRCETFFGGPQDIEWAIANDELFLLQSRPITTTRGTPRSAEEPEEPLSLRRFTGLGLAALLAPLNSTIIAVALPTIATSFESSAALVTRWLVTGYLVVNIVAQSPSGKLADLWGSSRVLTIGRALFGLGALLSALSPNLEVLGIGRVLMALGGALSIPTVFALLRRSVPFEKRGRIFGIFGAIMGGAAATGPILGGFLTARYGWHSVFFVNIPVVLLSFLLEPPTREDVAPRKSKFDFTGSALLGIAVLLLVAAVERVNALLAIATIVVLIAFVVRERRASDPVLDVALFRSAPFAAGSAIVALQNLAMYAILFLLPFFLGRSGAAPSRTGMVLLCFTAAMVLTAPIGGWLSDLIGARLIGVLGALVATGGAAMFVASSRSMLIFSLVVIGIGIGMSTSPSQAAAMSAVPGSQAGVAAGALSTMRYAGGVIGSGLVALLVAGSLTNDARLFIFPAVLFASAMVAFWLPGGKRA